MMKTENKLYLYLYEAGMGELDQMIKHALELQDEFSLRSSTGGAILFITFGKRREDVIQAMNRITTDELLKRQVSDEFNFHKSKVDIIVVPVINDEVDLEYIMRVVKSSVDKTILGIVIDGLINIHNVSIKPTYLESLKEIIHELNKLINKYQIPLLVSRQIPMGGVDVTKIDKDDASIEMHCTLDFN